MRGFFILYLNSVTDPVSRILFNYLSEFLFSVTIFIIFSYFSKVYRYNYLKFWSWSWLTFSLYLITVSILITMLRSLGAFRFTLSLLSQILGLLQILFLLLGTYELTNQTPIKKPVFWRSIGIVLVLSLLIVVPFSTNPEASAMRSILRFGVRMVIAGLGFILCAIWIYKKTEMKREASRNILCLFMILFGLEQLFLLASPYLIKNLSYDFGLVELFLISIIGLSMVMWLLEQEREKLSKANKELDSFLYSVSHDLRAPIASVLGLTNLAKMDVSDSSASVYFEMIEQRIKKLDAVIGDILHLSRSTKAQLNFESIPFDKLLAEVVTDLKFNEGAQAIQLKHVPDPSNLIRADYNQMKIILGNLLSNAVKYHDINKEHPFIAVSCQKNKNTVTITVQDNGQGIARESQSRIFDMFFRASIGTEGTGLGLYIVREAVNKLKGEVTVMSNPGEGSIFTITIPQ